MSKSKMKAYRLCLNQTVFPFGDMPEDTPILSGNLFESQKEALDKAGFELVSTPPLDEPYLLFSDRIWFTSELLLKMKAYGVGRLGCSDEIWQSQIFPNEEMGFELAICPSGAQPEFKGLELGMSDWGLRDGDPITVHPAMAHAVLPLRVGAAMAIHILHWTNVLKANQMALVEIAESARLKWKRSWFYQKMLTIAALLWRAKWPSKKNILAHLTPRGRNCVIHPTATIEACVIGDDVEIGPHAVVRASVISSGAKIEEHASVNMSILSKGAKVGRFGMCNLSVLYPGAMLSHGGGFQASVFGTDSFMAWGSIALDLSFGSPVKVEFNGDWVSSKQHFLGVCVGHRAAIGNGVKLNYGVSVPNDAILVGDVEQVFRDAGSAKPNMPNRLVGGKAEPISRGRSKTPEMD